jgi:glycine betaine/proline transport system ATP-binding protein
VVSPAGEAIGLVTFRQLAEAMVNTQGTSDKHPASLAAAM